MYWSWMVGKSLTDPTKVAKISGVNIDWDHGDKDTSIKAAKAMIAGYDIMYKPSLTSRHLKGFAIDMTITGIVGKTMKNQKGEDVEVKTVQKLYDIGAGYGVKKLVSDPPHWSDTGG